jgi:transposase InsO family protein
MSLTSADGYGVKAPGGAASGSVPRLIGAAAYATWAPLFVSWAQRNGVDGALERGIPQLAALVSAAKEWEQEADSAAILAVLGEGGDPSSIKKENAAGQAADVRAHRAAVIKLLWRTKYVYSALYEALSEELRAQIPTAPGDAFALWRWLENKFQSKEADNVDVLWKQWGRLEMGDGESFDSYRARVTRLHALLLAAKQSIDPSQFCYKLLVHLEELPRYSPVVLALKASDKLKDPANIDWDSVTAMVNAHERSSLRAIGNGESEEEKVLAAFRSQKGGFRSNQRHYSSSSSSSGGSSSSSNRGAKQPKPWHAEMVCHGCGKKGHIRRFCPTHGFEAGGQQDGQQKGSRDIAAAAVKGTHRNDEQADGSVKGFAFSCLAIDKETPTRSPTFAELACGLGTLRAAAVHRKNITVPAQPTAVELPQRPRPGLSGTEKEKALDAASSRRSPATETAAAAEYKKESLDKRLATQSWGIDSMASVHVSGNKELFKNLKNCPPRTVTIADGASVVATQQGTVELRVETDDGPRTVLLEDVLYNERFMTNLLGVVSLVKMHGWEMHIVDGDTHLVTKEGRKVRLSTRSNVTVLDCATVTERVCAIAATVVATADDFLALHNKLAHMSFDGLLDVLKRGATNDVGKLQLSADELKKAKQRCMDCDACQRAKATKRPLGTGGLDKGNDVIDAVHADSYEVRIGDRVEYGQVIYAPFSSALWSAYASTKDQLPLRLIDTLKAMQTQTGKKVKRLHTDGGSEFINEAVKAYCRGAGIELHYSPAGTPQLNGMAERTVRLVKEGGRTLLAHAGLTKEYWLQAVKHFVYVWNRIKVSDGTGMTPYEAVYGKKPTARYLGVFGCDVWVLVRGKRQTWDDKAEAGVYLGHDDAQSCPVVLLLQSGKIVRSKDVRFRRETKFEHAAALSGGQSAIDRAVATPLPLDEGETKLFEEANDGEPTRSELSPPAGRPSDSTASGGVSESSGSKPKSDAPEKFEVDKIVDRKGKAGSIKYLVKWVGFPDKADFTWMTAQALRRDGCQRAIAEYEDGTADTDDDADDSEEHEQPPPSVVHMAMSALGPDQQTGVEHRTVDPEIVAAVAAAIKRLETPTPETYREAVESNAADKWHKAMDKEMKSCEDAGTWERVRRADLPPNANVIPCKWVFKLKNDETGAVTEHKARLTPKGFRQKKGVDYTEVFARTGMYKTMRVGLALTAAWNHELDQMDVPSAFLNAPITEELYMEMPEGYREEGMVFKLHKALYGLKQAPRNWYLLVSAFLQLKDKADEEQVQRAMNTLNEILHMGFTASVSDPCLFFRKTATGRLILIFLFVDDFQISYHADDREEWGALKKLLVDRFRTKDMGESKWILGMRIQRDRVAGTITLDQELYVSKALEKFGLSECKTTSTPAVSTQEQESDEDGAGAPADKERYMEIVGTLLYATISTRVDISYAVQKLTRHMQAPLKRHMVAAERVLRYLAGLKELGLLFGRAHTASKTKQDDSLLTVSAFADADWANDKTDRKSITGWVAKVNGDVVSWASKKQRTVAQSTCEAELYAEAAAMNEVLWLRGLLAELELDVKLPSTIFGDNQSAIALSEHGVKSERTKHVDVKYHFITDEISKGAVEVKWVPSADQQADIFTKALAAPVFELLRGQLMTR